MPRTTVSPDLSASSDAMADDRHLEGIVAIARPQTQAIARQRIAIGTACDQRDVMSGAMQPGTNQAADRTRAEDRVACQLLLILPAFGAGNGSVAKARLCLSRRSRAQIQSNPAPFMTFPRIGSKAGKASL